MEGPGLEEIEKTKIRISKSDLEHNIHLLLLFLPAVNLRTN